MQWLLRPAKRGHWSYQFTPQQIVTSARGELCYDSAQLDS